MTYYIFVEDGKLNGCGQCRIVNEEVQNIEVNEEVFNAYVEDSDLYIWDGENIVENPDYEAVKERERKDARIAEIKEELAELDLKSIRPIRAGETERLAELEAQAVKLREELKELNA